MSTETETTQEQQIDAEFAFAVIRGKDGNIAIGNIDTVQSERQPTLDDIYATLSVVLRDLQSERTVIGVLNAIARAQQHPNGPQQTPGGLVVPEPKFRKVVRNG